MTRSPPIRFLKTYFHIINKLKKTMMKTFILHNQIVKILLLCLFIFSNSSFLQAQSIKRESISSYGATGVIGKVIIEQTVGQPYFTYNEATGNKVSVLSGFQQPSIFKITNKNEEALQNSNIRVFPNPANSIATLHSEEVIESSTVHIRNVHGKTILLEKVENLHTYKINCSNWENGIYFITISDKNYNLATLKLIIFK